MAAKPTQYWAVMPAAGVGQRFGAELPKQYLRLHNKTVLEHAVEAVWQAPMLKAMVVCVSSDDQWIEPLIESNSALNAQQSEHRLRLTEGGATRAHSVLNGLMALQADAKEHDWVLVHDAARPLLHKNDLLNLFKQLAEHPVGGLLAAPSIDTLKRVDEQGRVMETVVRSQIWRAQTPQLFRFGCLLSALEQTVLEGDVVSSGITDEASAIEQLGMQPQIVAAQHPNPKITTADDLAQARLWLESA